MIHKKSIFPVVLKKGGKNFFFYSGSSYSVELITSLSFEAIYIHRNISYSNSLMRNIEYKIQWWFPIKIIEMWK